MQFELGVRGEQALVANFHGTEAAIVDGFRASAQTAAELVVAVTRQLCAYDTGFMRDHVRIWYSRSGLVFEVGWDATDFFNEGLAFYPWFVEFGTRTMDAQPALLPAYEYVTPLYLADLAENVARAVARRAGGRA